MAEQSSPQTTPPTKYETVKSIIEDRDRLRAILAEARLQIEYLHEKFGETGSGNAVLARITEALS